MQINLNGLVSPSPEEQANRFKAELLKSFGISGTGFENQSLLDIFGAPGHSALGTAALRDVEQMRGWNFTAILAKALQFGLGNMAVLIPPYIAQAIADVHGEEYQASKRVNGTEQYGVPEDWVIAPRQHRIAKLLREPNKWTDEATFLVQIAEQTDIHGVAHILVLPDGTGLPKELWVIPKSAIRPFAPSHKFPEGSYRIGHLSKLSINMHAEDQPQSLQQALARLSNREYSGKYVISVGLPSPVFLDDFLNPSSAISDVIDTDRQIHVSRRNSLEQMMTNGPRFEPLPGVTLDNDQWNKMMDEFVANSTGPSRQGQPWRSPAGVKVVQDGQTNRELELAKAADQSRDHTLGQRLMNSSMLGLGAGGSYAQVIGLIKGNARLVLQPLMRIYSGQITLGLRRFFEAPQDQFMTILQAANIDDPEQRRAEIDLLMNAGAIEVGEVRQAFNMMLFNDERDKKIAGSEKQQGQDPFGGYGGDIGEGDYGPQDSGSPEMAGVGMPETGDRPEMTTTGMVKGTESEQPKYGSLSRREFARHQKNIFDILNKLSAGEMNAKAATLMLETIGLSKAQAQEFVATVEESTIEVNGANAMTAGGGTETATALFSRMLSVKSGFTKSIIDDQAKTAATHPDNGLRMPTEKDLKAGLYKKGKVRIAGLQIEIENPVGSIRSGKRPDGTRWAVEMCDHYGYIVGAVGYDKDQLDIFVRAGMEPEFDGKVFIINQADSDGEFDEHKCFIGCQTKAESIVRYLDNYSDNWADRIMSVSELTIPQFKAWMFDPNGGPIEGELTPDKALRYKQVPQSPMHSNVAVSPQSEEAIEEAGETDSKDANGEEFTEANPMRFQEGSGFFRSVAEPKDGDGDGFIFDGTPQQQAVRDKKQNDEYIKHLKKLFGENVGANGLPKAGSSDQFRDEWLAAASAFRMKQYDDEKAKVSNDLTKINAKPAIKRNQVEVIVNKNSSDIDDKTMRIDRINESRRAKTIRSLSRRIQQLEELIAGEKQNYSEAERRIDERNSHRIADNDAPIILPELSDEEKNSFLEFLLGKSTTTEAMFVKDIARDKRDGGGDGLINDGTPQERPVDQAEPEKKEQPQPQDAKQQSGPIKWATEVTPEQFIEAKGKSTKATFLSQINADDLRSHTFVLSEDGTVGAAVSPEGDIQNVFNNNGPKGAAAEVRIEAIKRGGKTLDCYAGFLPGYYSNFGFVETGRIKFNRDYAPDGWDYERFGEPDVVFMGLPERLEDHKARANVREFRTSGKQTTPTDRYYEGDQWDQAKSDSRTIGVRQNVGTKSWTGNDGRRNPSVNRSNGRVGRNLNEPQSAQFVRAISQEDLRNAAKEYSKPESRNAGEFRYATLDDLIQSSTDDTQQRAELIAEILTGVYGDSALRLISDGEDFTKMATLFKAFSDGLVFSAKEARTNRRRRNLNSDPRDADGDGRIFDGTPQERPAGVRRQRNTQEHISQVHAYVESALKGERTPKSAKELADKLSTLTVKQLTQLKQKYGISASGKVKKELVDKIAKRLDSGRRQNNSVKPVTAQPAKPAELTTDKKEKLDKIGAGFLDSLTPDANGRLINNQLSRATVKFSDTDVPMYFESLKLQTQVDVRKAYTNDIAETLKADADFKVKLKVTALNEVTERFTNEARSFPGATPEESNQNRQAALLQEAKALLSPNSEWASQKIKAEIEHRMLRVSKVTLYDYGRSKGLIKGETAQDAKNVLKKLGIEESEVASMIGAPDDWTVDVKKLDGRDMVSIYAQSPMGEMMRTIKMQDDQLVLKNNFFKLKPEAPKGLGLQIFSQQVAFAQSKGVTKIVTSPVREDSAEEKYKFVGYAVWPQFGYDADIFQISEPDTIEQVQQKFPNARTIRDIYDTPGGQEWWWKNGVSIGEATFELSDDSRNMKALQAYMSKKKQARQQVLGT